MKIAITGGTGFIGRRLVTALTLAGHPVRVLTRHPERSTRSSGVDYFGGDLAGDCDISAFLAGIDVLFHCAGEISDPSRMHRLHVDGSLRLVKAAEGRVATWIQLSSTGAYGTKRAGEVRESDPLSPSGPYEMSKAAADELVWRAANNGAFSCVILRPSIVYGAGMPNQSLFSMLKMVEKGLFCFIGKPGASANYVHVDNVVQALIVCGLGSFSGHGVFNLSDHCTVEEFVGFMARELGVPAPKRRLPEGPVRLLARAMQSIPGWPLTLSRVDALTSFATYPTTRLEALTSYRHKVSMAEGIADLVNDFRRRSP